MQQENIAQRITQRLETLRNEYQQGQQVKQELVTKLDNINATLLRISGAIQVLEELQQPDSDANSDKTAETPETGADMPESLTAVN